MKSIVESIIGKRGNYNYSRIVPKLEKVLSNDGDIETLAQKHNVSFGAMKDLFDKIKETVSKAGSMDISDRERAEWIDDILENSKDEILDDEALDRIAKEAGRNKESGISHAEGIKDIFLQVLAQGFAGEHLNHSTQDVNGKAVHPPFTGLKGEGQLADEIDISHSTRKGERV